MISPVFVALGVLALTLGANGARTTAQPHPQFVPMQAASPGSSIELTLGLPASNMEGLHAALMDVSDPKSPKYGKHLSKAEVGLIQSREFSH